MKRELEQTITTYYLECDGCGFWSQRMRSMQSAMDAALNVGWYIEERWNGLEYVYRHYCPQCAEEVQNADRNA